MHVHTHTIKEKLGKIFSTVQKREKSQKRKTVWDSLYPCRLAVSVMMDCIRMWEEKYQAPLCTILLYHFLNVCLILIVTDME